MRIVRVLIHTSKELKPDDLNMYIRDTPAILWFIYLSFSTGSCLFLSMGIGGKKNRATLNTKVGGNEYFMNQPSYLLSKLFLTF